MSSSARHSHSSSMGAGRHVRHSITDDIDALIGDYRAWQTESEEREQGRRGSAGTLVVDWDGSGYGQAFYRGRNSSPACPAEPSSTASYAVSQGVSSKASRATSSPTSRAASSAAASRAPSNYKSSRTQPTYTGSTISSSAKSKQSNSKPRVDSLFDGSVISTVQHRYADTEHMRPKALRRSDSTEVNFHRYQDAGEDVHGHADISVAYSPTTNTAHGHDPATQLNYAYNGRTMHVHEQRQHEQHRSGASTAPHTLPLEAYFSVPVEKYRPATHAPSNRPSAHIKQQPHKSLPPLPAHKKRTVKSLVKRVLSKLDSAGVLGKMRREREEFRKTEAWVKGGYFT